MTEKYHFVTPGELPTDAFTVFGVNAKPNSKNPIGFFGTGLKYAISIILRLGGEIELETPRGQFVFYLSDKEFRGKDFQTVRMKSRTGLLPWRYTQLPFTTELGKNWPLWAAFRELESNTRDEGGWSGTEAELVAPENDFYAEPYSYLSIKLDGFNQLAKERNLIFHDSAGNDPIVYHKPKELTIYDRPSKWIHYRGVRVLDLRYPARFTYDFGEGQVELSEDRTARNQYALYSKIADAWLSSIHDEDAIRHALKNGDHPHFEGHDLSFYATWSASPEFRSVASELNPKGFATQSVRAFVSLSAPAEDDDTTEIKLKDQEWETIIDLLDQNDGKAIADKIREQL